jgi:hypothetical protein
MADQKPKIQTRTETFQVYGEAIDVTYNFIEDPEKGELLQLDKVGGRIKLNPSQEVLANQLFLHEYIETRYKTDPKGADKWLDGILQEIIIDKCRTNRDVIAAKPCTNFQAYLMHLAALIRRDTTKIPYIPEGRVGSVIEIKRRMNAKAKEAAAAAAAAAGLGAVDYGALNIMLTIKLPDLLTGATDPNNDSDNDPESDTDSINTADYSTDDTDRSNESDDTITKEQKEKNKAKKKKIKKTFKPSDCTEEDYYERIKLGDVRAQAGGNPMETLYRIFKRYRSETCSAGNELAESLPYDNYIKMMLNQGDYQFKQFERIYNLYR